MIKIEKQLAVYLDNRPGMLARICETLLRKKINILALSVLDTVDHAVVRMIVDQAEEAEKELSKVHAMLQVRDVIYMDMPNEIGAMAKIAERLALAGINIEYAYCTCPPALKAGAIVLRTNDLEATIDALS